MRKRFPTPQFPLRRAYLLSPGYLSTSIVSSFDSSLPFASLWRDGQTCLHRGFKVVRRFLKRVKCVCMTALSRAEERGFRVTSQNKAKNSAKNSAKKCAKNSAKNSASNY